jgi:putative endopeptidase
VDRPGPDDPNHYVPYLLQGGLGMPDRAYYLEDGERMNRLRTASTRRTLPPC